MRASGSEYYRAEHHCHSDYIIIFYDAEGYFRPAQLLEHNQYGRSSAGLVNRIAYFSSLMAISDDDAEFDMARAQVNRTLNKLKDSHEALRHGSPALNLPEISNDNLESIYEDPMVGLEVALHRFLARVASVLKSSTGELNINSQDYIFLTTYGPHALEPMLDAAVDEYKKIARNSITRIEKLEWFVWLATIFTLFFKMLFIFRPFEKQIKQTLNSLEQSIATLTSTRQRLYRNNCFF